jgi:hypothetical protein
MIEKLVIVRLLHNESASDVVKRLQLRPEGSRYTSMGRFMECIQDKYETYTYVLGVTGSDNDPIMIRGYNFKRCDIQVDAIPFISESLLELIKLNLRGWDKRIHILK